MYLAYMNDSEEYQLLKEMKFVVGEKVILDFLKRRSCKECKEPIDHSSITEGEKIASGIKFKFVCKVSFYCIYWYHIFRSLYMI